ncbi:hypothetical protein [Streptomyces atratus]|uniref:hypothetical protein n=1 Tax=Streptomyces atratus TaxID=1893 RepID=UPI0033D28D7E
MLKFFEVEAWFPESAREMPAAAVERKVDKELNAELKKVRGKEGMRLRAAEGALSEPSGTVRRVI